VTLDVWNSVLVPAFIIPGFLAVIAGFLLLGVAVLGAGALLFVGALAMPGFNDQNWRTLVAVQFGVAWMAAGYALWSSEPDQRPARVR
jgi:hypothetical protein